tara:strand:- start:404 stop:592 length:189 start_codon:yes stop_codon:yes gene_type:complete
MAKKIKKNLPAAANHVLDSYFSEISSKEIPNKIIEELKANQSDAKPPSANNLKKLIEEAYPE